MKPDRSNYELWLIDWLDGTLDELRAEQFITFLNENPDIKAEAEFLSVARLSPESHSFQKKHLLKRTEADLPASQVEYLSVAWLEKDLSADQMKELERNLSQNTESRIIFETIQKTRLNPPADKYPHKSSLKKLTAGERIFRFTIAGLTAAATITILILSYILAPGIFSPEKINDVSEITPGNSPSPLIIYGATPLTARAETGSPAVENDTLKPGRTVKIVNNITEVSTGLPAISDQVPEVRPVDFQLIPSGFIPSIAGIDNLREANSLVIPENTFIALATGDERSRVRRFFAKTFREKLLHDDSYSDDPLKAYEIARAGVDGINKLFDWDMELKETLYESGEVKSVYFSSALLTFNAPHKKSIE